MITIRKMWEQKPLVLIMIFAIMSRLISVLFAKGYGMHDDHFLVIEWAQNLLNGQQINRNNPAGHSLVYPGLHCFLLFALNKLGLYKPDIIMYTVRFIHAAISIITVYLGYKIVLLRAPKKVAAEAGLLLAILWLFPFMSVRNLIEMVCIPFIMLSTYFLIKYEDSKHLHLTLIAGLFLGIAFTFRYQTNLFVLGFVLLFLFRKEFLASVYVAFGFVVSSFLIQGITDWVAYGYPYASFLSYYLYNAANANNYTTGAWYIYIFTIMGVLIPPTSLLIMFGFIRQWKRWTLLFWPTLLFLVFHSLFPNKQERFILPAIPLFIMAGIVGWREYVLQSPFWQKNVRFHAGLWKWFWVVNIILLAFVTTTYSKRTRVEVMNYLYAKNNVTAILVETSDATAPALPTFYLGKKVRILYMTRNMSVDSVRTLSKSNAAPNYLIMMNQKRMEERFERLNQLYPLREKLIEISPSLIDKLLYFLNPDHNVNQRCFVYQITENK